MPTQSAGGPCAPNASTGCSFWATVTSSGYFASTSAITTESARTVESILKYPPVRSAALPRRSIASTVTTCSVASSTSIARWRQSRISLRATAASSPRQNPVGRMDRVTAPKLPLDIPKGEQSLASGKGRFCTRVRPITTWQRREGFLAGTQRCDRGLGALQLLVQRERVFLALVEDTPRFAQTYRVERALIAGHGRESRCDRGRNWPLPRTSS